MKNCKAIKNNLPLYLDNSLSSNDKKIIEEHLKSCPNCTKAMDQLQKAKKLVNNLPEVEPPAWFKQKIMAEVHKEAEKKSFVQKWFYPLGIKIPVQVFTTIVIAVLAFYIYKGSNDQVKEVLPSLSIPAPVAKAQKEALPKQNQPESSSGATAVKKEFNSNDEKSLNEVIKHESPSSRAPKMEEQKNASSPEEIQKTDAAVAKDASRQVTPELKANKYAGAPAKSFEYLTAAKMKRSKKESNMTESAMNAHSAPQAQSAVKPHLFLKVENIDRAVKEIDKILSRYEIKNITRRMLPNGAIFTAGIQNRKIKEFTESVRTIGQMSGRVIAKDNAEYVIVIIEILE
ncbi:MAG: DUF2275 domain-containing protein [Smithella sp.]